MRVAPGAASATKHWRNQRRRWLDPPSVWTCTRRRSSRRLLMRIRASVSLCAMTARTRMRPRSVRETETGRPQGRPVAHQSSAALSDSRMGRSLKWALSGRMTATRRTSPRHRRPCASRGKSLVCPWVLILVRVVAIGTFFSGHVRLLCNVVSGCSATKPSSLLRTRRRAPVRRGRTVARIEPVLISQTSISALLIAWRSGPVGAPERRQDVWSGLSQETRTVRAGAVPPRGQRPGDRGGPRANES